MNFINSHNNSIIKEVKSLKVKKHRQEKGLFFIEGIRFVKEALMENAPIDKIIVSDELATSNEGEEILLFVHQAGCTTFTVPHKLFKELSDTVTPQGVMAVVQKTDHCLEDILKKNDYVLILDSVSDPGNLGTMIRTADACNIGGIILSKGCVDVYAPKVLRSTMGSIFRVPLIFSEQLTTEMEVLKAKGIRILAAHLEGNLNYFDADMAKGTAVIIGNEANGISEEVANVADQWIRIPMPGKSESLNAAVAASLLMYEGVRQRMK